MDDYKEIEIFNESRIFIEADKNDDDGTNKVNLVKCFHCGKLVPVNHELMKDEFILCDECENDIL